MSDEPPALPGIPPEADPLVRKLLDEPIASPADLRTEVETYLEQVQAAASASEQIDLGLAEALASRSLALLGRIGKETTDAQHRLIQTAVRYFILDEDAEGDLSSVLGFDDDVQVMNAVARFLGHTDLLIDID